MTTSSIPPIGPNYGVGRAYTNDQNQRKGKKFEEALEEETSEEQESDHEQPSRILQPELQVIRRDTEGDEQHIDVIA